MTVKPDSSGPGKTFSVPTRCRGHFPIQPVERNRGQATYSTAIHISDLIAGSALLTTCRLCGYGTANPGTKYEKIREEKGPDQGGP